MSVVWSILLLAIVVYSILGWSLYFLQPYFLYRPVREVLYSPADMGLTYEKVALRTADGLKIAAWYIPADKATMTVLFCHGNGGNMSHRLDTVNIFNELGINCLLFDYRGYGQSQGKCSEKGTYLDAAAAWNWLVEKKGVSPENIIVFGRSLGGSVAAYLAGEVQPAAVVLESTFTSYENIGKRFYPYMPVHLFASFKYNTIDYLRRIECPILVIHSRNDELIPFEFGLRLYDAAGDPKDLLEIEGSHNDGFLYSGAVYKQGWSDWVKSLRRRQQGRDEGLRRIS